MTAPDRVWLVTGAAGGIGMALLERVLTTGERVVAASRDIRAFAELVERFGDAILPVALDVTSQDEARVAVENALARFGRLDVVVNNAGYAQPGMAEELADTALHAQFETNFFGPWNVVRAALPHLRGRRSGHIIQISSLAGQIGAPGMAAYVASKHALEGFSLSLAAELRPLGIRVTIVEPGSVRTGFRARWARRLGPDTTIPDYDDARAGLRAIVDGVRGAPSDAAAIADGIAELVDLENPPDRLPLGADAVEEIRRARTRQLRDIDQYLEFSLRASREPDPTGSEAPA
ncbi:SDR family oxidoreductase [Actinoallomurus rhizosphaericola]|uniref:SDR family oxidoreductase n=1 Tax=Actinoallomurus rhizosphaericola TaxID=2952536 RepID=UPI00209054B9|nr:SDR family oxidoreductase [Actinoallomurus rhizosphaericola]MCO5991938.1 SDR family oxidoreductase [Actinoallomurus rhizosphaericola]